MKILALDLSLSRTGVAECDSESIDVGTIETRLTGPERLVQVRDLIVRRATLPAPAALVVIENYAFNARHSQAHALGELGGVVRVGLHEAGVRYLDVVTQHMKKYATGAGNASKEQVLAAAARRAKLNFHCTDEADAWWLLQMAIAKFCPEHPRYVVMPALHQAVLAKVHWPELASAA